MIDRCASGAVFDEGDLLHFAVWVEVAPGAAVGDAGCESGFD